MPCTRPGCASLKHIKESRLGWVNIFNAYKTYGGMIQVKVCAPDQCMIQVKVCAPDQCMIQVKVCVTVQTHKGILGQYI